MPWWVALYFLVYCVLAVAGLWDDYRDRRPAWYLACSLVSEMTVAYFFVARWWPALLIHVKYVAPLAFVAAISWEVVSSLQDIRWVRSHSQPSGVGQRDVVVITAIGYMAFSLPFFVIA